jgi:DNA-binding MurR/RpiR family transcriptional regulator
MGFASVVRRLRNGNVSPQSGACLALSSGQPTRATGSVVEDEKIVNNEAKIFSDWGGAMSNVEDLFTQIHEAYDRLPRKQKLIADYISSNVQEVIFYSISELAAVLETSEAAVVRFSQSLGYSGYPQLRKKLIQYYKEHLSAANRIKSYLGEIKGQDFIYPGMVRNEVEYLSESVSSIDKNSFNSAVRHLCRADTIYVFGSGSNESLASYLCFRLNRFRKKTVLIPGTGKNIFEKLILLTPKDFVVVYAFYKPTTEILSLFDYIQKKQIPSLLITDTRMPLMVRKAGLVLYAKRGPFGMFLSSLVPMAVTNALIIRVAEKLGDKAMKALRELSDIRTTYYHEELSDLAAANKIRKKAKTSKSDGAAARSVRK